jgi:hypothetical protein
LRRPEREIDHKVSHIMLSSRLRTDLEIDSRLTGET